MQKRLVERKKKQRKKIKLTKQNETKTKKTEPAKNYVLKEILFILKIFEPHTRFWRWFNHFRFICIT